MSERSYWSNRGRGRRRLLGATLAGGTAAAILAACGGDSNSSESEQEDVVSRAATPAPTLAAAMPKRGGKLVVQGPGTEQPNHDTHQTSTGMHHWFGSGVVYSRLVKLKIGAGGAPESLSPTGDVAASWETPDPATYIFRIRPESKFQNIAPVNGRAVTAADVAYSYQRQRDLRVNAALLADITQMQAVDSQTLRLTIGAPNVDFVLTLTDNRSNIVPRELVEQNGDLKNAPVIGSGPWMFVDWTPSSVIRFKRNPDYWLKDEFGQQLPYADELEFPRVGDASTAISAFRTDQIQRIWPSFATKSSVDSLKQAKPNANYLPLRSLAGGLHLVQRSTKAPATDMRVRQAIIKALDPQQMLTSVEEGQGFLTAGVTVPQLDYLLPQDEIRRLLAQDVAGARALLQQAGVTNWRPNLRYGTWTQQQADAGQLAQQWWRPLGIETNLVSCDNNCLNGLYTEPELDLAFFSDSPSGIPTTNLQLWYKGNGGRNLSGVNDAQLDSLIDAQAKEADSNKRKELFLQIQRRVLELAGRVGMYNRISNQVTQPYVKNYIFDEGSDRGQYDIAWLDR